MAGTGTMRRGALGRALEVAVLASVALLGLGPGASLGALQEERPGREARSRSAGDARVPETPAPLKTVDVRDSEGLRQALAGAAPGTLVRLAPGEYRGGLYISDLHGQPGKPIVVAAAQPDDPPRVVGGGSGLHLADVSHLELRDLVFQGASDNGLNIDDGGTFDTPSHHVVLHRLRVSKVGPSGNRDGIKLSGIDDFRVVDCTVEEWGDGGSGIDMVGCHKGVIEGCTFRRGGANAVQAKGGTRGVVIRRNRFEDAGQRAVNLGGSTGLAFFRPKPEGFEAKDLTVEGNVFVGSDAPIAFVGVDGAVVRYNTLYRPNRWALRILQETRAPGFVPCRRGVFTDNIVVFRSGSWFSGGVNIGPDTAPETFRFARNLWYCEDRPTASRPALPTPETDALIGVDPKLRDPERGDFSLPPDSPGRGRGATALPAPKLH